MRSVIIAVLCALFSGCASIEQPAKEESDPCWITGTLLHAEVREEGTVLFEDGSRVMHWEHLIEFAVDGPPAFAGLRVRFSIREKAPFATSYADLVGKRVRLTTPRSWMRDLKISLPIASSILLEEEAEPGATDNPDGAQRLREDH